MKEFKIKPCQEINVKDLPACNPGHVNKISGIFAHPFYYGWETKRGEAIFDRLRTLGYIFSKDAFKLKKEFAEEQLTVIEYKEIPDYRQLYLDFGTPTQMLIASWNTHDEVNISFDGPERGNIGLMITEESPKI